jgi:predicted component of type VI protein secretion system
MDAKLVVAGGKTSVKEIPLVIGKTIIGRRNDCALRIMSHLVSRQHCELDHEGVSLVVKDLGSSNGTFVNGIKVQSKQLRAGDTLVIGPITFVVQIAGASPSDTKRPPGIPVAAAGPAADDAAALVIEEEAVPLASSAEEGDAADFVLAEESAPADGSDFVVAEEVVVAEELVDTDTPQDLMLTDIVGAEEPTDMTGSPPAAAPVPPADAEEPTKKKGGLFGKMFKKNPKTAEAAPAAEPASPPAPAARAPVAKAAPTKSPPKAATPSSPSAPPPDVEDVIPLAEDPTAQPAAHAQTDQAAQMGEEDLANFLMGLNAKDE